MKAPASVPRSKAAHERRLCPLGGPLKHRLRTAVPGLSVFAILWLLTFRSFDWTSFADNSYAVWQSLGRHLLEDQPWASLQALHIQPPGLNLIEALDLATTPAGHGVLAALFALGAALSVFFVVDTLSLTGVRARWAALTGVGYALLPSTVVYSLWPFSTLPAIFACSLALWGVALARRSPAAGVVASAAGVVLLWLFRSSFPWVFVLAWLVALAVLLVRNSGTRRQVVGGLAGLMVAGGSVMAVQAHYLVSFGLWSTSSWAGENIVKALDGSGNLHVTQEAMDAAKRLGPCQASLVEAIAAGQAPYWAPDDFLALPGCDTYRVASTTGVEALDSPYKDGASDGQWIGNFNTSQRLADSAVFSDVAKEIVKGDPLQLVRMAATGGESGSRGSGLSIYLAPSDDYFFVTPVRTAYPDKTLGGLLSLLFAPAAATLTLLGLVLVLSRREKGRLRRLPLYYFTLALMASHATVSVLFEYGENNRFQAEVAPAFAIMGALVLWSVVPTRSPRPRARPAGPASDGSPAPFPPVERDRAHSDQAGLA